MDEFERNEINGNQESSVNNEEVSENTERNTNAPSGWTYSANTNRYVSWDGSADANNAQWNPGAQKNEYQQPPRKEYGTQYGYYGGPQQTNYYSNNGNYQWDFNKYESAEKSAEPKAKKSSRKGLKVFLGIIGALLAVCIISVASIGIYQFVGNNFSFDFTEKIPLPMEDAIENIKPDAELPDLTLQEIPKENNTVSTGGKLSATEVYKLVSPSVVGVVQYQYSTRLEPAGYGSGIIISDDGYIVTNAHVIEGAEAVKVILYNEEEYEATIIGSDIQTDIAVLKINAGNLVEANLGDSSQLEIGETVYALGNPGGLSLQSSFTDGMVSGLDRVVETELSYYMSVIQTSAAINPGNSGGALINEYGQVIGITSAKIVSTNYEGIGFAIPTDVAKPLIEDLITKGYVSGRAKIGVTVVDIDSVTAKYYGVPEGVQIIAFESEHCLAGTPVAIGDIITHFNGTKISGVEDLHDLLEKCSPGDAVEMQLYRYTATGKGDYAYKVNIVLIENRGQ